MSLAPPFKRDFVRATGRSETEREEEVVLRKDEFWGSRKLVTFILADNGLKGEYDVFGILDSKGYLRNDLVSSVNAICCYCGSNYFIRKENKDFYFDLNTSACIMLGRTGGPPPGEAYDVGKLTVSNNLQCPWCLVRFRITMGRMCKL